jgi:hypothetical protein
MECLSCGWKGEAQELRDLKIKLQATQWTWKKKPALNAGASPWRR